MANEPKGPKDAEETPGRGPVFARPWLAASILLLAAAVALLWFERPDAAFVAAALAVSAWFYNVRSDLRRKHDLVRLSGRNWVPRDELDEADEDDDGNDGSGNESGDDD